jgi:hypothetical protein
MHTRASRLTLIAGAALLAAACDATTGEDPSRRVRGTMRLALVPPATAASVSVWNLARVRLLAGPSGGAPVQDLITGVDPGNTEASFDVTVPVGLTRFRAEVLSNRDTVLLDGETTTQVASDGFKVEVRVAARRPVLLVTVDTSVVSAVTTLVVSNPGAGVLSWRIDPTASAVVTACNGPCATIEPQSGSVPAGRSITVALRGNRGITTAQPLSLRLTAPEGYVDLLVRLTAGGR